MKKIKSIYFIFIFFCVMIVSSFAVLYGYSRSSLNLSLKSVSRAQMEHSIQLLDQKTKEIEIEADGILNSSILKNLQLMQSNDADAYDYAMGINALKDYLSSRQTSTVGMSMFVFYWQDADRVLSTAVNADVNRELFSNLEDDQWFVFQDDLYFARRYVTDWDDADDEPWLLIKAEKDYLYNSTNVATETGKGRTLLIQENGKSLFSITDSEAEILKKVQRHKTEESEYEVVTGRERYQILESGLLKNGLNAISYYPIENVLKPVKTITWITGIFLLAMLLMGLIFMVSYYRNILLQLQILTGCLKRVEDGDLNTKILPLPDNEFAYVFEQFNWMTDRIRQLIDSTVKEQQLRSQAEMRQLQLQINPHFLYNCLSYIVTVAEKPKAVTQMAVLLSRYYRYCTKSKAVTTIGEEVAYAQAYLSIMAMRKSIECDVSVAEELYPLPVIPLILQPIIENAIEHGIEERENAKHVFVKAYPVIENRIRVEVSDDGSGMSREEMERLKLCLRKKESTEGEGIGLWNVNQRLINYYGETSGLEFDTSIWGGLRVSFTFLPKEDGDDGFDRGR